MSDESRSNIPSWVRAAQRVDRPELDAWYKPEDGDIDGVLVWRGRQDSPTSGDVFSVHAIRLAGSRKVVGVSERAGLRDLRSVRLGSRVFIHPTVLKTLDSGRKMQQFEIHADDVEPLPDPPKGTSGRGGGNPPDGDPSPSEKVPF